MTRDAVIIELAKVSHRTWMYQAERDKVQANPSPSLTAHDFERARDLVHGLEALKVLEPLQ